MSLVSYIKMTSLGINFLLRSTQFVRVLHVVAPAGPTSVGPVFVYAGYANPVRVTTIQYRYLNGVSGGAAARWAGFREVGSSNPVRSPPLHFHPRHIKYVEDTYQECINYARCEHVLCILDNV